MTINNLNSLKPNEKMPVIFVGHGNPMNSITDNSFTRSWNVDLFIELRKLRDKGVLFIGSGNNVHNLGMVDWGNNTFSWAQEFDDITRSKISLHDIKSLTNPYKLATSGRLAVPTDDHYRPMLASMSLIDSNEELEFFNESIDLGSIGMRSFITK